MAGERRNPKTPRGLGTAGDYYQVRAGSFTWEIGAETAVRIGQQLERRWRPRWLKFVDLHGARVWVRTDTVFHVAECTELQRVRGRELDFALTREENEAYKRHHSDCDSDCE